MVEFSHSREQENTGEGVTLVRHPVMEVKEGERNCFKANGRTEGKDVTFSLSLSLLRSSLCVASSHQQHAAEQHTDL